MNWLKDFPTKVDNYLDSVGDPISNVSLPGAPWKIIATILLYLTFVLKIGPAFMRDRKPLIVDSLMRMYNVANVLSNVYLFAISVYFSNFTYKTWTCQYFYTDKELPQWAAHQGMHLFTYLKLFDLLDTVFFVLRKKNNQITVLHIVHHSLMPLTIYFGVKFAPFYPSSMIMILNSFVHSVMYSYYFMASYGPKMQPYLWWKKHLTLIQLIQFAILLIHSTVILMTPNCDYPKLISYLHWAEASYFSYAFGKFYIKNYRARNAQILRVGKED